MNPPPRTHRTSRQSISVLPSGSTLTEPSNRGPRQSVNPTTTVPPVILAHKKRSKSLGGANLEQHVRQGNLDDPESLTLTLELTPRKKARRSLVPGKSILKSRPTVTGLERTASDSNLTSGSNQPQIKRNSSALEPASQALQTFDQPSGAAPVELPEPQITDKLDINHEPIRTEQDGDGQAGSDVSSDMDVSDEQALHRISLGSNATNLLRRVSFAAKAHVRTFGSPILDPDSSAVSSAPSAVAEDTPAPMAHSSLRPDGGLSEDDSSADMSIDNSLLTDRPADSNQPVGQAEATSNRGPTRLNASGTQGDLGANSAAEQFKQHKASRLSVAIPGFGDDDEDEDDEGNGDVTMQDLDPGEINRVTAPDFAAKVADAAAPKLASTAAESDVAKEPTRNTREHSQDMDLTTPFQPISNNSTSTQKSSYIPRPSTASKKGFTRSQSVASDQQPTLKGSRLSMAFPEYARENEEEATENLMDLSQPVSGQGNQIRPTVNATKKSVLHSQSAANNHQRTLQGSQLSVALPQYMRENEEDTGNHINLSSTLSSQGNQTRPTMTHDASKKAGPHSQSVSNDQRRALKGSRLSVAFPEYARGNEATETENLMDISPPASAQGSQPRLMVTHDASRTAIPHLQSFTTDQQTAMKGSRLSMAFPEYARENEEDETENLMDLSPNESGERNQSRPSVTHDTSKQTAPHFQSVASDQQHTFKSSRLSVAFPDYTRDNEGEETGNPMDLCSTVSSQGNQTRPTMTQEASDTAVPRFQSVANEQQRMLKGSRLSMAFSEYARDNDEEETGHLMDIPTAGSNQGNHARPMLTQDATIKAASRFQSSTNDQQPTLKGSRLSMAFPEYARDNGDEAGDPIDISTAVSNQGKQTKLTVAKDHSAHVTSSSFNKVPEIRPTPQVKQVGLVETKNTKKGSRLTNFLGYAEDEDDEADSLPRDRGDESSPPAVPEHGLSEPGPSKSISASLPGAHHLPEPTGVSTNQESQVGMKKGMDKPSQLTEQLTNSNDVPNEHDNVANSGTGARPRGTVAGRGPTDDQALPSEPIHENRRSRITEFLQREDTPNQDDEDSALIDFNHQPANYNFQPPRGSQLSTSLPGLEIIKEDEDDSMNESLEYSTLAGPAQGPIALRSNQASRSLHASTTSNFRTSLAISQADSLLKSSTASSRSSELRRGPPLRNLKNSLQITSASPARRMSGSLSGSPRPRPSFPSPRRSAISARSSLDPGSPPRSLTAPAKDLGFHSRASDPHASGGPNAHMSHEPGTTGLQPPASRPVGPSQSRSPPEPPSPPAPATAPTITLNEFFEQAEICFISLSQPRVRNHDQQEQFVSPDTQKGVSSFAEQIFAGMVKIPRVRMLESSSRILRQKTEMLDNATKEYEREIEQNPNRYKLLRDWLDLRQKQANSTQPGSQVAQKHVDELNKLMNHLRLKKNLVEISSKRESTEFGLQMWRAYQANLSQRREKLRHDLEMMRKMSSVVEPSTEALRSRKLHLTEEIRRRKQKKAEIDNCDQNQLKALKEEAKDLAAETEANRRALAESDFERNMWSTKLAELEEEKTDHMERIEQMRRDPDQSQKCTLQELIRLQNEFVMLQRLMGWELIRFEDDLIELLLLSSIAVIFHLDPYNPQQLHRNVGRIEVRWTKPTASSAKGTDPQKDVIEEFFSHHMKIHFQGKRLEGRMKDFVQQIVAMWNHARQLTYEVLNLRTRFKIRLKLAPQPNSRVSSSKGPNNLQVIVAIHSRRTQTSVDALFEFNGEEILDWKSESNISHISCKVSCHFGKADCSNLTYIICEHVDRGNRGALKEACLEAWGAIESSPVVNTS